MLIILEIHYLFEGEIILTCPINYAKFPFHSATCKLRFTSVTLDDSHLVFRPRTEVIPDLMLDTAKIRGYSIMVDYLTGDDTIGPSYSKNDVHFSVVGLKIDLVSKYKQYIFVYFIPTSMFTMTSWVSYLLPPTSYPARTSLLVTVFLCQVGIFTSAIKDTPSSDEGGIEYFTTSPLPKFTDSSHFPMKFRHDSSRDLVFCLHYLYLRSSPQLCGHSFEDGNCEKKESR